MRRCPDCGQPYRDGETHCSICHSGTVPPPAKRIKAQPEKTFDFSRPAANVPQTAAPQPVPQIPAAALPAEAAIPVRGRGQALLGTARTFLRDSRTWVWTGSILLGLALLSASVEMIARLTWKKNSDSQIQVVEPHVRQELDARVSELLAEKLEWGRQILRQRIPSRFPEELLMDHTLAEGEVMYEDSRRQLIRYPLQVAYHYKHAAKKTYPWTPVAFYFELRQGQWILVGDRWLREWELHFE